MGSQLISSSLEGTSGFTPCYTRHMAIRRYNIRAILNNPTTRRELCVRSIQALQNLAGIPTTRAQAEAAYDEVRRTRSASPASLPSPDSSVIR